MVSFEWRTRGLCVLKVALMMSRMSGMVSLAACTSSSSSWFFSEGSFTLRASRLSSKEESTILCSRLVMSPLSSLMAWKIGGMNFSMRLTVSLSCSSSRSFAETEVGLGRDG
ncbi:hypothetical protein E2C01_064263 [Portunus trituberculatus]|uniref:Secreted protein n=1 Tax=Portunus trituberculatus TaxID=210409 RepID=A0A5B7HMS4_PORTR|nr:hypothetical protein [Portunus trituberculatus]